LDQFTSSWSADGRPNLQEMPGWERTIAHVDMDAFYVSVELLRRPELRGKPVVVATGTDPHARGVVMAASYEARRFGVHSALPLAIAHRRCPQMVMVPRHFDSYRAISRRVMAVLRTYSDRIEVAGLDEAYLDLSGSPAPKARGRSLKADVKEATGLVCSVGIAPNKLIAKIASDLEKPDGFCVLDDAGMLAAVGDRPASLIPGVGPKTHEKLARAGIRTVAELAGADPARIEATLGRNGLGLRDRARGVDERALETRRRRKSESRETTFADNVRDRARLAETLGRLSASVCEGLASQGLAGRTVTMKLRLAPFRTHTRSLTLRQPTNDAAEVAEVARGLLERFELDAPVRLIGVGISSLEAESGGVPEDAAAQETLALPI
jgi:nucleotidyltransferase/DNA polymerase involved in DNA repair